MAHINIHMDGHRDSMTDPAQWGRVSENTTKEPLKQNKHTKGLLEVMKPGNDKQGKENLRRIIKGFCLIQHVLNVLHCRFFSFLNFAVLVLN